MDSADSIKRRGAHCYLMKEPGGERRPKRVVLRVLGIRSDDAPPRWIQLPIAQAERLNSHVEMPRNCETVRHRGRRRPATTFHAIVDVPGQPDRAWVACAECTSLMMDEADANARETLNLSLRSGRLDES
jgi:hypothetical protein